MLFYLALLILFILNPIVINFYFYWGFIDGNLIFYNINSLIKVSMEHGLYGDIVFTSGLGAYFYHAQGLTFG